MAKRFKFDLFKLQGRPLRQLLLFHELIFIALILMAVISGSYGISLWEKSSNESQRIHLLVQEIHQVRGDLYRQMKELFDAFFLHDGEALSEYQHYTTSVMAHFEKLHTIAQGAEEKQAISNLEAHYKTFVNQAPALFYKYQAAPNSQSQKSLYEDIETGIFSRYESVSNHTEQLLEQKQLEIKERLEEAKARAILVFGLPVFLAVLVLFFSRFFLKRSIVKPIRDISQAMQAISAGDLKQAIPASGPSELALLAQEINKMADDLADSRDALVRSEKQAAMGLLVPMLAHNIRNPLASIRATAQIMDDPDHDQETKESLQGIIDTVDRLERWTGALLAYLNPVKLHLNAVSLSAVIQGATSGLQSKLASKRITLIENSAHIHGQILSDEHLLEQLLYNLILNAIEASPMQSEIRLHCARDNAQLTLTLTDEGTGMPFIPDPTIKTPGPTTKRFGTGLGIPFAFKVCDALGGQLSFQNLNPKGTEITIILPQ